MNASKHRKSINYSKDTYPSLFPGLAAIDPAFRILFKKSLEKLVLYVLSPGAVWDSLRQCGCNSYHSLTEILSTYPVCKVCPLFHINQQTPKLHPFVCCLTQRVIFFETQHISVSEKYTISFRSWLDESLIIIIVSSIFTKNELWL